VRLDIALGLGCCILSYRSGVIPGIGNYKPGTQNPDSIRQFSVEILPILTNIAEITHILSNIAKFTQ
jgi:hypothetical protein